MVELVGVVSDEAKKNTPTSQRDSLVGVVGRGGNDRGGGGPGGRSLIERTYKKTEISI